MLEFEIIWLVGCYFFAVPTQQLFVVNHYPVALRNRNHILLETIYFLGGGGRRDEGRKYIVNQKPQMLKLAAPSNKSPLRISVSTGRQSEGGGGEIISN